MPIRKDGDKRWVEMEILVPGTPEQVRRAAESEPRWRTWLTETFA